MDELTYEDTDEDGNPLRRGGQPKWRTEPIKYTALMVVIQNKAYSLRKYFFADQQEQKAWKKIEKSLDKGNITQEWVLNCANWAKTKYEEGKYIPFITLENLILNPVRYREWLAKNKMASRDADTFKLDNDEESFTIE